MSCTNQGNLWQASFVPKLSCKPCT